MQRKGFDVNLESKADQNGRKEQFDMQTQSKIATDEPFLDVQRGPQIQAEDGAPEVVYSAQDPKSKSYSMKWYYFLIYFLLWVSMALTAINAALALTGAQYEDFAEQVYELLPSLKFLDTAAGVIDIIMIVLLLRTWYSLKKRKAAGPKLLCGLYLAEAIFSIVYALAVSSIIENATTTMLFGDSFVSGGYVYQYQLDLSQLTFSGLDAVLPICSIVMAIANRAYFKKRADLFIN